jgi:hypothetical protein
MNSNFLTHLAASTRTFHNWELCITANSRTSQLRFGAIPIDHPPVKTRVPAALCTIWHNGSSLGGMMKNRRKMVVVLGAGALDELKNSLLRQAFSGELNITLRLIRIT